jgi:hypothetical protein
MADKEIRRVVDEDLFVETRSATTDAAILLGPSLAVSLKIAHDHLTGQVPKQEKEDIKEIELPQGYERE